MNNLQSPAHDMQEKNYKSFARITKTCTRLLFRSLDLLKCVLDLLNRVLDLLIRSLDLLNCALDLLIRSLDL